MARLGQASEDYSRIEDARRHDALAHHSRRVFNALPFYYHFIQTYHVWLPSLCRLRGGAGILKQALSAALM